MKTTQKRNGYVLITSNNGIIDIRHNVWYSEVVVKECDVKYFRDGE